MMNGLMDPMWESQLQKFEPLKVFTLGRYTCKLMVLQDSNAMMSYPYRLFVFEEEQAPLAAFNYEVSGGIGAFYGVTLQQRRMNFGPAPEALTVQQFYDWALQTFPSVLKDVDEQEVHALREEVPIYDGQSLKKEAYKTKLLINHEPVERIPNYTLAPNDLLILNDVRLFAHQIESDGNDLYFYHEQLSEPVAYFILTESYVHIQIEQTPRGTVYKVEATFLKNRS